MGKRDHIRCPNCGRKVKYVAEHMNISRWLCKPKEKK